jgi:hypothetical protein
VLEAEETAEYVAVETHDQRFRSYVEGMGKEAEATILEALDKEHARGGEAWARRGEAVGGICGSDSNDRYGVRSP